MKRPVITLGFAAMLQLLIPAAVFWAGGRSDRYQEESVCPPGTGGTGGCYLDEWVLGRLVCHLQGCDGPPYDGQKGEFSVNMRIPGWSHAHRMYINGEDAGIAMEPGTYCRLTRQWKPGDEIQSE